MSKSLQEIRDALDEVDQRIVDALAARHELIALVPEARPESTTETARDEIREHEILARVEGRARQAGLDPDYVASLFREIIQHSVDWQSRSAAGKEADDDPRVPLRVGYQGGAGAYSHLAAIRGTGLAQTLRTTFSNPFVKSTVAILSVLRIGWPAWRTQ